MVKRTPTEKKLLEKAAKYLPDGSIGTMKLPFVVSRGLGSHVWDVSENKYIDFSMGAGPMILGHAHPAVTEAVCKAAENGSTFFAVNENAILLAEEIVNAVPCAEDVRFTTSGTDACLQAMRAARAYTGREKILKFEGAYHGTSDYAFISSVVSSAGIPCCINDTMLVSPYNDLAAVTSMIEENYKDIAAVIVEPMQRIIMPLPGFLEGLREITERYDIPLIFDEVVTGFRMAYGGAQERFGITPNLCTLGKIVGGGHPLAAVCGSHEIMSVFDQTSAGEDYVSQIGTLNGNSIACAAGLATLRELRKEGNRTYTKLAFTSDVLREMLALYLFENNITAKVLGDFGTFDVAFVDRDVLNYQDLLLSDAAMQLRFNKGLLKHGILKVWPHKWHPSLAHTDDDINKTLDAFRKIIPHLKNH